MDTILRNASITSNTENQIVDIGIANGKIEAIQTNLAADGQEFDLKGCMVTPGFIETDMTRHMAVSGGKTPAEMGMKSPEEGTSASLFLLMGNPEASGYYYGSDCLRSPLDRYRSPGDPPYNGD